MPSYAPLKVIESENISQDVDFTIKNKDKYNIIKYKKDRLNNSNMSTLGLLRSVIMGDGKILCFSPPKSIYFDIFTSKNNIEDCYFEEFIEGTMINAFWDPYIEDWNIATRSNIGAKCKYNVNSNKTFRYMFLDAMNHCGLEFQHLDKNFIYSFVLQHPENRIVIPIITPTIQLAVVYKVVTDDNGDQIVEKIENEGLSMVNTVKKYTYESLKNNFGGNWEKLRCYFNDDALDYKTHGIVVYNKEGERMKIRSKNYEKIKMLKGNSPKLQFHYYYLRQNGLVKDFLQFYPEHRDEFRTLRTDLHSFTNQLYQYYIECYIKKEIVKKIKEYPYNFKIHMFNLHKHYMNNLRLDKKFVSRQVVIDYINNLHPAKLMHSINHTYNKHKREEKTAINITIA